MSIRFSQLNNSLEINGFVHKVDNFRASLLNWFDENGRHWIPWKLTLDGRIPHRGEKLPVYGIWIAEVMLQQTQLKVVLPYWQEWMKTFPTLISLAHANENDVLLIWQGLGYYSRAKRIYQSSKLLLDLIGYQDCIDTKNWPNSLEIWESLPGIGRSTAGSIISSAFDLPIPILDGNLKRVFLRLIASTNTPHQESYRLWNLSFYLLDKKFPRKFNQALMDLGALICTPSNPNCCECPINNYCLAYSKYNPKDFPVRQMKKSLPSYIIGIGIVMNSSGKILIAQRKADNSMGGMWEFPGGKKEENELIEETIVREIKEEVDLDVEIVKKLITFNHSYSHKKFQFIVCLCDLVAGTPKPLESNQVIWVDPNHLKDYPFPSANTRIINEIFKYLEIRSKAIHN
ncbi:8-oxo-dGTP diphosphatase MutT [Prochlorococcus sp. MIT 1223]|uniref:8-oxo-dGTP diphosphatase MutT n=1 Tax=Prochlorococcus sp. MIT 1223 TaxID=3096217 RepID=UPI002A750D8E|nr:8-oxo-dGTP diphosphatase MutT [Prochlorococcus sp. MIT 1223]